MRKLVLTITASIFALGFSVAQAADIPRGMIAPFVMDAKNPKLNVCPSGWSKFEEASGKFLLASQWNGNFAIYTPPDDGNLQKVKIEQANLPSLNVDFGKQILGLPTNPRPNIFNDDEITLFGAPGTYPAWNSLMRQTNIKLDIGGSQTPLQIKVPSETVMVCKKD